MSTFLQNSKLRIKPDIDVIRASKTLRYIIACYGTRYIICTIMQMGNWQYIINGCGPDENFLSEITNFEFGDNITEQQMRTILENADYLTLWDGDPWGEGDGHVKVFNHEYLMSI